MAKKRAKDAKAEKPKQGKLPGFKPKKIAAVETAAEAYVEVRDARMELTKKETEARDKLAKVMRRHGITSYANDGTEIEIEETSVVKVKVRVAKPDDDEED